MYKCVTRCIIGQMIHSVDYNSLVSCHAIIYASTWSWSEGGAAKNERSGGAKIGARNKLVGGYLRSRSDTVMRNACATTIAYITGLGCFHSIVFTDD